MGKVHLFKFYIMAAEFCSKSLMLCTSFSAFLHLLKRLDSRYTRNTILIFYRYYIHILLIRYNEKTMVKMLANY